ncbi:acetyltransferase, GNAT family [Pseudoflavonifractor capillosus ATCC 29799]|uniref:Acetyltransferase, GNAT family n=1 Tax=Pseudoflavonifractor capillosus ATCC 29799 TaxID=411467 RepID=A6NVK6_9FIRM|nr:GNAT family protein [Pseudoflavonifractor capillosus]EDM99975.1 acetyltransferase, GNAT family [Pseudoflavonifractor capillosus ATCC 29799]
MEQHRPRTDELELYVPKLEDLWFMAQMESDPDTMSYNRDWDVSYPGYHRDTGCVDFPPSQWESWYAQWVGREPERFAAYIRRKSDGQWLGDVCFHYTPDKDWWDMGIVLYAPYRGQGYAVPALKLLLDHAFRVCKISRIHNDFEIARQEVSAWQTHFAAGFSEYSREDGWMAVMITREQWLAGQDGHASL